MGSLAPQSRAARDPFSRVPEPEFRSCKTTSITPRKGESKDKDQSLRNTKPRLRNLRRFMVSRKWQITKILREVSLTAGPLSIWGEFTLISPVGLVKPFPMLMRGRGLRPFLARKGERCMKDTVHAAVHRSVHLFDEGKFYGTLRLRFTRPLILDKGKTPEWAGATPLRCHGNRGGRSSPPTGSRQQKKACGAAMSSENPESQ